MDEFRFIHTSDLHLGRRFGSFDEEVRARLIEARHGAIGRLAQAARDHGAAHVLIAGDVFDTEFVSARVRGQALAAMAAAGAVQWWLLPGNHDSLNRAEPLWDAVRGAAADNVRLLDAPKAVDIAPGVQLLPAPVSDRSMGVDATLWMEGCDTPPGDLRIGLAHGGVRSFGSDDDRSDVIPPDRAESARLDYLALGDWHGTLRVSPRCWYSGTPERDGFRHEGRGACLAVTLRSGRAPEVTPVATGTFDWRRPDLSLTPEMPVVPALEAALPGTGAERRDMLVRLRLGGRVRLQARAALTDALSRSAPLFWHLEVDETGLATEVAAGDLDEMAESGALKLAAEALHAEAADPDAGEDARRVAGAALDRLHALIMADRA